MPVLLTARELGREIRSWSAMHESTAGWVLLALGGTATLLLTEHAVDGVGPLVRFAAPIPVAQLITVVLAIGVSLLLACRVDPRVLQQAPSCARLRRARVLWAAGALLAAAVAASSGVVRGVTSDLPAILANLLLLTGLATLPVAAGRPELSWFPPAALVLVSAVLGVSPAGSLAWWAIVLSPEVGPLRWVVSGVAAAAALSWCALRLRPLRTAAG